MSRETRQMDRRNIFKTALAAGFGVWAARGARAEAQRAQNVVYHLADADKVAFVLGNLANHLQGAGGPGRIALAVVVHGPALASFRRAAANRVLLEDAQARIAAGIAFHGCAHTMAAMKLTLDDLLPGFSVAEKGGVVLLADLQAQGWAYLRP
jgi:intracellular sulfur oxidation DsrE/DsrF family protein